MAQASRDQNNIPTLLGASNVDGITPVRIYADPVTHRLLVDSSGGFTGTVTSVSVVTANGFAGSVANPTTTPAITLETTVTGLLKGNGTAISAAVANTDYQVPITLTTTGSSGAATFNGTTLNIPNYAGGVTSVSGTTNRITVSPTTGAAVVDISATFEALLGKVANPLSQFATTTSAQLAGVIIDATGTGVLVFGTSPTFTTNITTPMITGGTGTTSTLTYKTTTGVGTTGADHIWVGGNNGASTLMRLTNSGQLGLGVTPNALIMFQIGSAATTGTAMIIGNTDTGGHEYQMFSTGSANGAGAGAFAWYDNTSANYRFLIGANGGISFGNLSSTSANALTTNLMNFPNTSGVANCPTASQTDTISHGLGRVPSVIRIQGIGQFASNGSATPTPVSIGTFSSSGNRSVYMRHNSGGDTVTQNGLSSTAFAVFLSFSSGNFITGVIQNVTSTSFDIVWTETGTVSAMPFLWEAQ